MLQPSSCDSLPDPNSELVASEAQTAHMCGLELLCATQIRDSGDSLPAANSSSAKSRGES
eukprot:2784387-Prymnesium_polylepis.1